MNVDTAGSIQDKNPGEEVESPEGIQPGAAAMYEFVPVDRYADNEEVTEPLKDLGESTLGVIVQTRNRGQSASGGQSTKPKLLHLSSRAPPLSSILNTRSTAWTAQLPPIPPKLAGSMPRLF